MEAIAIGVWVLTAAVIAWTISPRSKKSVGADLLAVGVAGFFIVVLLYK